MVQARVESAPRPVVVVRVKTIILVKVLIFQFVITPSNYHFFITIDNFVCLFSFGATRHHRIG
jgi:hypothetical protein